MVIKVNVEPQVCYCFQFCVLSVPKIGSLLVLGLFLFIYGQTNKYLVLPSLLPAFKSEILGKCMWNILFSWHHHVVQALKFWFCHFLTYHALESPWHLQTPDFPVQHFIFMRSLPILFIFPFCPLINIIFSFTLLLNPVFTGIVKLLFLVLSVGFYINCPIFFCITLKLFFCMK